MPDYGSRPSQVSPVASCDFLAHSCAAARELHPLPNSHRLVVVAPMRAHEPNSIVERTKVDGLKNLLGQRLGSQPAGSSPPFSGDGRGAFSRDSGGGGISRPILNLLNLLMIYSWTRAACGQSMAAVRFLHGLALVCRRIPA
jgi:hypothetical protein